MTTSGVFIRFMSPKVFFQKTVVSVATSGEKYSQETADKCGGNHDVGSLDSELILSLTHLCLANPVGN